MVYEGTNATGWNELFNGSLFKASYTVYSSALGAWVIPILFIVFQFMLYYKTRNATLMWVTGLFFVSLYATAAWIGSYVEEYSVSLMFIVLVFELAGIFFVWIMK